MSEKLDWLARNVHVWPLKRGDALFVGRDHRSEGFNAKGSPMGFYPDSFKSVTRQQWLDRRAELQNKPSWADHQDAKCFVQRKDGAWFKNKETPSVYPLDSGEWAENRVHGGWEQISRGEVLGDWRDTLELRPEPFNPFTSIEENQEQNMQKDNGWFDRGELPPVGVWCEASCEGAEPEKCKVIAYHKQQVAVQWSQFNDGCLDVLEMPGWAFRPIRPEREKAIEDIANLICKSGLRIEHFKEAAIGIYDAGYRKEFK